MKQDEDRFIGQDKYIEIQHHETGFRADGMKYEPSKKSEDIDRFIESFTGVRRDSTISSGFCMAPPIGCGKEVTKFRDDRSEREYKISGLCQECQDLAFTRLLFVDH